MREMEFAIFRSPRRRVCAEIKSGFLFPAEFAVLTHSQAYRVHRCILGYCTAWSRAMMNNSSLSPSVDVKAACQERVRGHELDESVLQITLGGTTRGP